MKKLVAYCFLLIALVVFASNVPKQHTVLDPTNDVKFGVKIGILPTGGITQYALFFYKNNRLMGKQPISKEELVKIGTGKWPIPRTTKFHDFFKENDFYEDTLENGEIIDYGAAFDSLWKVRFQYHPMKQGKEEGWSNGDYKPSLKQQKYIYDRYGVRGYDQDYFSDTSFFKLLKDVMNPEWIKHYKSLM